MPKTIPLKYRELIARLKRFGVVVADKRGKGSEVMLIQPIAPGSKQGPQIPIKHHGDNTEIKKGVINAVLRRFNINPDEFWER